MESVVDNGRGLTRGLRGIEQGGCDREGHAQDERPLLGALYRGMRPQEGDHQTDQEPDTTPLDTSAPRLR